MSDNPLMNGKIAMLNAALRDWCAGREITYIDMNPELAPDGSLLTTYTWDGLHLSGAAYLRWRDTIAPYIAAQLRKTPAENLR
jgi:lysophospholipase L1-like esterase